jgi:hypothetical protein
VAELGLLGFTLPGTISVRTVTCGRATCRCAKDPDQRHGPYIQWFHTVKGRTVNKMLTAEQLERYQPWIDNGRRVHELAHQLETLSLQAMRTAEDWNRGFSRKPSPPRSAESGVEFATLRDYRASR